MKLELKSPETKENSKNVVVQGSQLILDGENLSKDVFNVTLKAHANDIFRLEIEQVVRKDGKLQVVGEPGVRKFYLLAPIALNLEVVEIVETESD